MEALVRSFIVSELGKATAMIEAIAGDNELLETVERIAEVCAMSIEQNGKVMFAGNGGSAADAQHLAAELVGKLVYARPAMPAIALTTDTSILTAVGNDFGYHKIFVRQIETLAKPDDIFIGISTSGRSTNVLEALDCARRRKVTTVGLTERDGGSMSEPCDYCAHIPAQETAKIQEGHIMVGQIFCSLVEREIHPEQSI